MNITDKTIQSYIRQAQKNLAAKYKAFSIGNNLWLRVHTKTGNAAWLYRIALPDQTKKSGYRFSFKTIGQYPETTLYKARNEALRLSDMTKQGVNPNQEAQIAKESNLTVKEIWEAMLNASTIKPRTLDNYIGMYKNHIYKIGDLLVKDVNNQLIYNLVINPILENNNSTHANMVLCKLKQAFNFAYNTFLIDTMPIDSRLAIPNEYKIRPVRDNTLSFEELPLFLQALDEVYNTHMMQITYHHLIKLLLLLGTRKTELVTAKWEQYNQEKQTLLITGTKTGDDLLIKLPHQAVTMLEELKELRINEYIFYSSKINSHLEPRSVLKNLARVKNLLPTLADLTIHDLRRTFSSRLTGLKFKLELIEKATNHKLQGTARHYQHDDMLEERFEMLQYWADYLDTINANSP